jgi:hypothetical protein
LELAHNALLADGLNAGKATTVIPMCFERKRPNAGQCAVFDVPILADDGALEIFERELDDFLFFRMLEPEVERFNGAGQRWLTGGDPRRSGCLAATLAAADAEKELSIPWLELSSGPGPHMPTYPV